MGVQTPADPGRQGRGVTPWRRLFWVWGLEGEEPAWPKDRTAARPRSREPGPRTDFIRLDTVLARTQDLSQFRWYEHDHSVGRMGLWNGPPSTLQMMA